MSTTQERHLFTKGNEEHLLSSMSTYMENGMARVKGSIAKTKCLWGYGMTETLQHGVSKWKCTWEKGSLTYDDSPSTTCSQ